MGSGLTNHKDSLQKETGQLKWNLPEKPGLEAKTLTTNFLGVIL